MEEGCCRWPLRRVLLHLAIYLLLAPGANAEWDAVMAAGAPLCCRRGQAYDLQQEACRAYPAGTTIPDVPLETVDQSSTSSPIFAPDLEQAPNDGALQPEQYPNCSSGMFVLDPVAYPEDRFVVLMPSGELQVGLHTYHKFHTSRYCLRLSFRSNPTKDEQAVTEGRNDPEVILTALACFPDEQEHDTSDTVTYYAMKLTPILLGVSVVFLALTFGLYLAIPRLRDLQGQCLMSFLLCMALAFIFLIVVQTNTHTFNSIACRVMGFLLYYWFVAIFFWLVVLAFNIWKHICWYQSEGNSGSALSASSTNGNKSYRPLLYRLLFGFGSPFAMMMVLTVTDLILGNPIPFTPGFGYERCWFHGDMETLLWFYGPIAILLVIIAVFFILSAKRLWTHRASIPDVDYDWFSPYLKLILLSMVLWFFEIFTYFYKPSNGAWLVIDIILALQGIFVFLIFFCRREVFRTLGWFSRATASYRKDELNSTV